MPSDIYVKERAPTDPEPPIEMLPAVDSFVSIIERLPGLVLEDNAYVSRLYSPKTPLTNPIERSTLMVLLWRRSLNNSLHISEGSGNWS